MNEVCTQAQNLFRFAEDKLSGEVIDCELALPSLRLVSEDLRLVDAISYRALRGLTDEESKDIRDRESRLKEMLRTHNVDITSLGP